MLLIVSYTTQMLVDFNNVFMKISYHVIMSSVLEREQNHDTLPNERERYLRVYSQLLEEGFAEHTRLQQNGVPSENALRDWGGYMHAVVEYYGQIPRSFGPPKLTVTLPADAPRLYRLFLSDAQRRRPTDSSPELEASLKHDPSGKAWIEQEFHIEQKALGTLAPPSHGVQEAMNSAARLYHQQT